MIPVECVTHNVEKGGDYPRSVTITPGHGSYGRLVSENWSTPLFELNTGNVPVIHDYLTKGGNSVVVTTQDGTVDISLSYPISQAITLIMYADIPDLKTGLTDLHVVAQVSNELTLTSATIQNLADAIARALPST